MPVLEDAQRLANLGLSPVWLVPPTETGGGKRPIHKEWASAPWSTPQEVEEPPRPACNMGIRTGYVEGAPVRVIVVDGDSQDALQWMQENLPQTPMRVFTSRGEHWYYLDPRPAPDAGQPVDPPIKNGAKLRGMALDVRGDGGQAVAPPSVHPTTGDVYRASEEWTPALLSRVPHFDPKWLAPERPAAGAAATAEQVRLESGMRNLALTKLAGALRRKGLSVEAIRAALGVENTRRCDPPLEEREVSDIARSIGSKDIKDRPTAEGWGHLLLTDKNGSYRGITSNAVSVLLHDKSWSGVLAWSDFSFAITFKEAPPWCLDDAGRQWKHKWVDEDAVRLKNWLAREYGLVVTTAVAGEAATLVAKRNSIHEVREYLEGLTADPDRRLLDTWLVRLCGAEDTPFVRRVGRWWLISAVARIMAPGCQADHMLILEGPQGIAKSSLLRALFGDDWFMDTELDLNNKDAYQALQGKWCLEWSELDTMGRSEMSRVKAYITSRVDNFRPPYGRVMTDVPRQCIFAGTVNHDIYLRDETGGRRFWPVKCGTVNVLQAEEERHQLWAEAVAAYQAGEPWWPHEKKYVEEAQAEQAQRAMEDSWEASVNSWLALPTTLADKPGERGFTLAKIAQGALDVSSGSMDRPKQMRLAAVMKALGWVRFKRTVDGRLEWRYYPPGAAGVPVADQAGGQPSAPTAQEAARKRLFGDETTDT